MLDKHSCSRTKGSGTRWIASGSIGTRVGSGLLTWGVGLLVLASLAAAQEPPKPPAGGVSAEELSKANNPLANANALNFQNYFYPSLQGVSDASANALLLRPVMVSGRQIIRATLPVQTTPTGSTTYASGLGDFSVFDAFLVTGPDASTMIGVGPLLVTPSATDDSLGAGKWQAGAAAVAVHPMPGGSLIGSLVTWQTDFAGDKDRPGTNLMTAQPFLIFQIGGGFYVRSSGLMTFDFKNDKYLIPFGIGVGKVFKIGGAIANAFLEPQFSVYSKGDSQPQWQVFSGLNLQWFKHK
jgi:hypothetical protein